jgi:hypothetical protein
MKIARYINRGSVNKFAYREYDNYTFFYPSYIREYIEKVDFPLQDAILIKIRGPVSREIDRLMFGRKVGDGR